MFTDLNREEQSEEGDRGGQEDKRGESKGVRQIQPVIRSLSVLQAQNTQRDSQRGREEKGKGGDIGDLVEKKESQKREGAIKPDRKSVV